MLRPLYHSYCYSKIPATVRKLFGLKANALPSDCYEEGSYDTVVLFMIDGFGWRFFEKYREKYPFLKRFCEEGIASKITSQFPSTTAAHVTCIHTGLDVGQSGIYEWFYYEPLFDAVIAPLLYSPAGDKEIAALLKEKRLPQEVFPFKTVYQELLEAKIPSFALQHESIASSPYSKTLLKGSTCTAYNTFENGLRKLASNLEKSGGYFFVYFGDIDAQAHRHGVDSAAVDQAVDHCFTALEKHFWQKIDRKSREMAVILTADHGMVDINPKKTFYINEKIPEILPLVRKNSKGELLAPAGSCRDFFLHTADGQREKAQELLQEHLEGTADVYSTEELIAEGLFGEKKPSERFWERAGDLVILPYAGKSVWWHEPHRFEMHFHAMHGGLSPEELETTFLFLS